MFFELAINGIIAGSVYGLISLGFNMIYLVTKFFNIAYGAMAVIGAYVVFYLYTTLGWNLYLSIALGLLCAGTVGFLSDKIIFMPLRNRQYSSMGMFVASLGLFTLIQAVVAILFTSQFHILTDTFEAQKTFLVFGAAVNEVHLSIIASVIIILILFHFMITRTMFGKAVKALGDDLEVSKVVGINTDRVMGHVFFIGSAIAGLSGILVGFDMGIEPTMGMRLILKGVTAAIIGGIGNVYGGVLGAFILGFIENYGVWKIPHEWKDAISFGLLIVFLLFRPRGLFKYKS